MTPKVFGIGFHKTATSSLAEALKVLGYRVTGPNREFDPDIADILDDLVESLAEKFDAFQDNPWPLVYQKMDALYPGSKFILTTRAPEKWRASLTGHFQEKETPMRALIYGADKASPLGNEDHYVARMLWHNQEVRDYFADRPDDLLEIDLTAGAGWEPICAFLDQPVPDMPFPRANTAQHVAKDRSFPARMSRALRDPGRAKAALRTRLGL